MYTVLNLQERLEQAKDNLREVEDHILKVDGKPSLNQTLRYKKQDREWQGNQNPDEGPPRRVLEESAPRRRGFALFPDGDSTFRRRGAGDEGPPRRRGPDGEGPPRRRPFAPFTDEDPTIRKRIFSAVPDDDDTSPVRKKAFKSVVGKVQLPDLSVALKRGRERRERESQGENTHEGDTRPRSVFARLSGVTAFETHKHEEEEEDDDEDELILKRQPALSSRVLAIEHPTPSREQVMASQKQDEVRKQRDRRMFGALVGTLQQFRREETQVKEKEERRQQIEKKLEDDARREKERLAEEKRSLQLERRRREGDIKRIEWSLNRVKEFAAWEVSVTPLRMFIRTKSEPHIFYLPKNHTPQTEQLLEESANGIQEMIEQRLTNLNREIENSEKKAKRAAGDADDINKENEGEAEDLKDEEVGGNQDDGEMDETAWEEATYGGDQLEREDFEETTEDHVVPAIENNDNAKMSVSSEVMEQAINGNEKQDGVEGSVSLVDDILSHKQLGDVGTVEAVSKGTDEGPSIPLEVQTDLTSKSVPSSSELLSRQVIQASFVPSSPVKQQILDEDRTSNRLKSKSPEQSGPANIVETEKNATDTQYKWRSLSPTKLKSRSRSSSQPRSKIVSKKSKDDSGSRSKSRSPKKRNVSKSPVSSKSKSSRSSSRKPLGKSRSKRSASPRKQSKKYRSPSKESLKKSQDSKLRLDKKSRRSRSLSKKRDSPSSRRQRRSRSRSNSPRRRSRSRSGNRRRQRRTRSRSLNRRRRSRSSRRSPRKRSPKREARRPSPASRSRKRSVSSSSSNSDSD